MTNTTTTNYPPPVATRNEAIARIRAGLKMRTGITWSVTGGRGTGWGWLRIDAPPARRTMHWMRDYPEGADFRLVDTGEPGGYTTVEDRLFLAAMLGLPEVHDQGVSVPASNAYYNEFVDRAEGRAPRVSGQPYWD